MCTAKQYLTNCHHRPRARLRLAPEACRGGPRLGPGHRTQPARPSSPVFVQSVPHPRFMQAWTAEAVAEVATLAKTPNWNDDQWYDFACVYSLASGKIADKKQEYADRAMELLQKAVQAGYKNASLMAKDTDLDPLRDREDFKKLLASLPAPDPKSEAPTATPPKSLPSTDSQPPTTKP